MLGLLVSYVLHATWYLSSSCCSETQCTHVQLSPFYHLSTLDVMHDRKDTHTHTHVAHTHTHVAHTFTLHTHTTAEADDYSSTIAYTCWNSSELLLYRLWAVLVQAERSLHSLCRVWDLPYPVLCLYPGTLPVVRLNLQFFILSVGVIL